MANINKKTGRAGNFKNLSGQKFGKLTVLRLSRIFGRGKKSYWLCVCECGKRKVISKSNLKSGNTKSCGCLRKTFQWLSPDQAARNSVYNDYKTRAKRRGLEWGLSDESFDQKTQLSCHYCGSLPTNKATYKTGGTFIYNGIDRKDNSVGYIEQNIVPCCKVCNFAKGMMSYPEFLLYIQRLSDTFQVLSRESR